MTSHNDCVVTHLEFLSRLLSGLALHLLLLVELVDEFILVCDLIIEVADLVVLGGLVLLDLSTKV